MCETPDARALEGADLDAANRVYAALHFAISRPALDPTFGLFEHGELAALGRLQRYDDGGIELGGFWVREDRRRSGLARRMVRHVLAQAGPRETLYCIPFLRLEDFYRSCGLTTADPAQAPASIRDKIGFCQAQHARGRYAEGVSLLVRAGA